MTIMTNLLRLEQLEKTHKNLTPLKACSMELLVNILSLWSLVSGFWYPDI